MNFYLLDLIGKWIKLAAISFLSIFNFYSYQEVQINNENITSSSTIGQVVYYETEYIYNSSLPTGTTNVVTLGQNGYYVTKEDGTLQELEATINEVLEVGAGSIGEYTGSLTNYGPDCYGCSAVGNVACFTKEGQNLSLYNQIYYDDYQYGMVRILAADLSQFPCGTIVLVSRGTEMFYGVVLDTGSAMRNAWDEGYVLMDLAHFSSYDAIYNNTINGSGVSFEVVRWGW
ncbi:MAG: G5 domain-containing protein [Mycoplasmatota bacterium]